MRLINAKEVGLIFGAGSSIPCNPDEPGFFNYPPGADAPPGDLPEPEQRTAVPPSNLPEYQGSN